VTTATDRRPSLEAAVERAQRLSREATFYLIQAQTGSLRGATLTRIARPE
jgi:hypothetical protein